MEDHNKEQDTHKNLAINNAGLDTPIPGVRELRDRLTATNDPRCPYDPALHAVHSRSRGYVYRVPGIKTGRIHHLLSRLEYNAFLFFDFSDHSNIREQFALPLALTLHVAKQLGIRHPRNWKTNQLVEMTTDFVLSDKNASWVAIDVKPAAKLESRRTKQKLELTNHAFATVGVKHVIVTEKEQPKIVVDNYRILHGLALPFDPPPFSDSDMERAAKSMRASLASGLLTLRAAAGICERDTKLGQGRSIRAALWLVANRRWIVDLTRPIGPDESLTFIS